VLDKTFDDMWLDVNVANTLFTTVDDISVIDLGSYGFKVKHSAVVIQRRVGCRFTAVFTVQLATKRRTPSCLPLAHHEV